MPIMLADGWDVADSLQELDAPRRLPVAGSSRIRCEECDRGILSRRWAYRRNATLVVLGYLLLIPSVVGVLWCACTLIGINADIVSSESAQKRQTPADAIFRSHCAQNVLLSVQAGGLEPSQVLTEEYCECALATFNETKSNALAAKECAARAQNGTLAEPTQEVDVLYSADDLDLTTSSAGPQFLLSSISSSAFLFALGGACFLGGVLSWFLVMKKRVLQCSACGAFASRSLCAESMKH